MAAIDLNIHAFSTRGSFLKITRLRRASGRLMLGTSRAIPYIDRLEQGPPGEYYEIALIQNGAERHYNAAATPTEIRLTGEGISGRIAFIDADTLLFEVEGAALQLLPCHSIAARQRVSPHLENLMDYRGLCVQQARVEEPGTLEIEPTETIDGKTGPFHDTPCRITFLPGTGSPRLRAALRLRETGGTWPETLPTWEEISRRNNRAWNAFWACCPDAPPEFETAAETAWYILWSATGSARGLFTREPVLMSPHWMNQIWAWDNCFVALALARADIDLALDQLRLFFDHRGENGLFPEPLNEFVRHYGYVKPPIYGWTILQLDRLLGSAGLRPFATELHDPIAEQTEWWFRERDVDRNGFCEYLHGNDSGWDNATLFDQGGPVEGADLCAHLALQCEGLARLCELRGRTAEKDRWMARSGQILERLVRQRWKGTSFTSPKLGESAPPDPGCLLNLVPVELGRRLPRTILDSLVAQLSPGGPFLTEWGLATQRPDSQTYQANGYWRGPIWAPSTGLIFSGLVDAGEHTLARDIALRFCRLCARDNGFWENYDALGGQGLCCPHYTWTAAVFLLLAEYLEVPAEDDSA